MRSLPKMLLTKMTPKCSISTLKVLPNEEIKSVQKCIDELSEITFGTTEFEGTFNLNSFYFPLPTFLGIVSCQLPRRCRCISGASGD